MLSLAEIGRLKTKLRTAVVAKLQQQHAAGRLTDRKASMLTVRKESMAQEKKQNLRTVSYG